MQSKAKTVSEYLKSLPKDRRDSLSLVRKEIKKNLPKEIVEVMNWGMISYELPLKIHPDTYNGKPLMYAALASQKNYMAVYLSNIYGDKKIQEWFEKEYKKSGKKLDMGKCCVRFKKLEDLPVELIGKAIGKTSVKKFIEAYQRSSK